MAGSLLVVVGAFLPWARSGRVDRSSFALVAVATRVDLLHGPAASAAKAWYVVPALGGLVWLAAATGRDRLARAAGTALAVAGVALAVVVRRSPLAVRYGASASIAGAVVVGIGLVVGLTAVRGRKRQAP